MREQLEQILKEVREIRERLDRLCDGMDSLVVMSKAMTARRTEYTEEQKRQDDETIRFILEQEDKRD